MNKTSTACEGRLVVKDATWMPDEVKARLLEQQHHRLNSKQELIVSNQDDRSQARNRARVLAKMQEMVDQALVEPKTRQLVTEPSEHTKSNWIAEKKTRSRLKDTRRSTFRDDY